MDDDDNEMILQLDDGNVIEIRKYLPKRHNENIDDDEQALYDDMHAAVQKGLDNGLTAVQITGMLYLVTRRFSQDADEW